MNTVSIDFFNKYLGENELLISELQNTNDKKSFVDSYLNEANKVLSKNGLKLISRKEVENSLPKMESLAYEEINDFQMSASSAHTQSSCTTSTSAGCAC